MERILVTGALGQLGTELVRALQNKFGAEHIFATDINLLKDNKIDGNFSTLDVLDKVSIQKFILRNGITQVYHLAAMLSAKAEATPSLAWQINMDGLINILDIARDYNITKIFWPSSIAVFGPDAPKDHTPHNTILNPHTIYGITKVAGEKLCAYYNDKFGLDIRSIRYPGLIGHNAHPGGGTTDYAVE
ncbi:MAG: NAD-dependent epimerase/dehydratase family protein, partial [Draconibacterium sp.]|nr:NAD-dependent epimerase/dehydratase family protein [Draconibacterium sp.]